MSLSRTPSGLAAQYLFYKEKVLVYVEGHTDIPCTAYGFLGHSLKEDCDIMQSH